MNRVQLFGNLGADPELRITGNGTQVLNLRLATNERVKKGDQWEDHTEWHAVVMFGKRCEWLGQNLQKGSRVLIDGKLRTSSYEKDGVKRYKTEIIADDIELGERQRLDDGPRQVAAPRQPARGRQRPKHTYGPDAAPGEEYDEPIDQLPF